MKTVIVILTLSTAILMSSCALMFKGTKQDVYFKSNTADAKVYSNLDYVGRTNEIIPLKRAQLTNLYTIKTEGCRDTSIVLPLYFSKWCYLDAVGVYPALLDFALDVQNVTEDTIYIDLDCKKDSTLIDYE